MRFRLLFIWMSIVAAGASAQTPSADLRLVKSYRPSPQGFVMTVTNFGPNTLPGPITVTDTLPAPAKFLNPVPAPWTCTPALPASSITCSAPGPLAPGNSVILTLRISLSGVTTNVVNCASVTTQFADPNSANNRDCACVDVNPCRDVNIDLTTGRENGVNLAAGSQDQEWRYVPSSNTLTGAYVATGPWSVPSGATAGRWINPHPVSSGGQAPTANVGAFIFEFPFTLGSEWGTKGCRLRFRFAADNNVSFSVNGGPSIGATPTGSSTTSAAWTNLTAVTVPIGAGTHILRATVNNGSPIATGPTGLFVQGDVHCPCAGFPDDPFDPATSPAASP